MQLDAVDLRDFYRSPLGHVARRQIGTAIRAHWRKLEGGVLLGAGYATPYLGQFRKESSIAGAIMPEQQGAVVWPSSGLPASILAEEHRWPLPDNSVDYLLAVHCVEAAERIRPLLREMWRVLSPNGSLMIVAANRRGIWSRFDTTPFGQGRPFSRSQLEQLLRDSLFTPVASSSALYIPPIDYRLALKMAPALEKAGRRLSAGIAGAILIEARKDVAAPITNGHRARVVREVPAAAKTCPDALKSLPAA